MSGAGNTEPEKGSGVRRGGRRFGLLAAPALVAVLAFGVVAHDVVCSVQFQSSMLCRWVDGTLWRDPSNGCTAGNDVQCPDAACPDSVRVSEPGRRSCSWLMWKEEVGPQGPPPHYRAISRPGCADRRGGELAPLTGAGRQERSTFYIWFCQSPLTTVRRRPGSPVVVNGD